MSERVSGGGGGFVPNSSPYKFSLLFSDYESENPVKYWVPFVNYERYSINYVCKEYLLGLINVQNTWIIARDRMMSEEDYDDVMRYLDSVGINTMKLEKADQRNCRDDQLISQHIKLKYESLYEM